MFEGFPQKPIPPKNEISRPAEDLVVTSSYDIEDEQGNVTETVEMQVVVESEEVKRGAEELLKRFGGFLSMEESIKYALSTPEQLEDLEKAIKQREQRYEQGLTIEDYDQLKI